MPRADVATVSWQADCESILREIAGDDISGPVYLLSGTDVERYDSRLASNSMGWTSRVADLMLAGCIGDQWRGRGFCCVLYPQRCVDPQTLIGCVLHEAGHHITYGPQGDISEPVEAVSVELLSWIPERPAEPIIRPSWYQHEQTFVRTCCYLAFRANQVVESIRPHHLSFSAAYYPPPFDSESVWMAALGSELHERDGEPIGTILQSEPPTTFVERWRDATRDGSLSGSHHTAVCVSPKT